MILIFSTTLLIYVIISSLAWLEAKRKCSIYWSDLCSPLVLPFFWLILSFFGYGFRGFSGFYEIVIILISSALFLNIRVFFLDRYYTNYKINSYLLLTLGFILVFLLRTFMQYGLD
ncbi:hypothetical protein PCNPT3_08540 [Psychromonas sp. CNPT3]|nr:hypothetical protein PCNPT3_08540 [Psychromonas sp. CNPT3]